MIEVISFPFKMPGEAEKGKYTLRVEGSVSGGGVGNFIFENDTTLEFFEKQVAVFIQTNKPVYKQGQKVYFRVVPVKPNLMPGSQMVDIYILVSLIICHIFAM
jgi:hypothetical protein